MAVEVIGCVGQFDKVYGTGRLKGGNGGGVEGSKEEGEGVECGEVEAVDDKHVGTEACEDIGWNVRE